MKILVTGGSGRIGKYVIQELVKWGHDVVNADLIRLDILTVPTLKVNLVNIGDVYQALNHSEADTVIHLAAWSNVGYVPDARTFGENVLSTYNIFTACADLEIKRIVYASSAQVYGLKYGPPQYLPLDEDHPYRLCNAYSLSKSISEQTAQYFIDNRDLTILSFHFFGTHYPHDIKDEIGRIAKNPEQGITNLWTFLEVRDVAIACRLAAEKKNVQSGLYNLAPTQISLSIPTLSLINRYFGDKVEIRSNITGTKTPVSIAKAKREFGFQPQYLWTDNSQ